LGKREAEDGTTSIHRLGSQESKVMRLAEAVQAFVDEATPPDLG
jgi:threonyl-tRNA synthetase